MQFGHQNCGGKQPQSTPVMFVLLWHHFCYYKRHWIILVITIVLPFILVALLFYAMKGAGGTTTKPSQPDISALLSNGPFDVTVNEFVSVHCSKQGHRRTYLDDLLRNDVRCAGRSKRSLSPYDFSSCQSYSGDAGRAIDKVARGYILFYPNNSSPVQDIMSRVTAKVQGFAEYLTINIDPDVINSLPSFVLGALSYGRTDRSCVIDAGSRIIGFKDLHDARKFVYDNLRTDTNSYDSDPLPQLWGMVGFEKIDISRGDIEYDLVFDSQTSADVWQTTQLHLQSLIERAIISRSARQNASEEWSVFLRYLPNKCWDCPDSMSPQVVKYGVAIMIIVGFLLCPINSLNQMVTEKTLRLREYLAIMGVSSFSLKFSWWLFYMIFLLPLSIFVSLFISYFPPPFFQHTSLFFIFIVILLFNMAQLSFCFLMSAFLTTTRRTWMLLAFLHLVFWIVPVFIFQNLNDINGAQYYWAHVLCLYCTVPLTLACMYLAHWEEWWIGTHSYNAFMSPYLGDEFGGIGACLIWLAIDTILYMVIAWYIEKVFPGEYGTKQPPYFLFQPSYWFPSRFRNKIGDHNLATSEIEADIELVDHNAEPGIRIRNLTKIYANGQIGVNRLSIDFYKQEVTAFLGQNGAGKSTTLNSLVGVISPSSGSLEIDGYSVTGGIPATSLTVGFVPQHDILYPSLTLQEHLLFYGMLKGLTPGYIRESTRLYLDTMDLSRVVNNYATNLSGGQKRKLSILTAYLGKPSAVILDEPTSGVDPFSRRSIWDLVMQHRVNAATIISTHQMQEADMLADRIAIISNGGLVCYGSPAHVKERYGSGLKLTVAMQDDNQQSKDIMRDFVLKNVKNSTLDSEVGDDMIYLVPPQETKHLGFPDFLEKLQNSRGELRYRAYGLSEASMEDVFFRAIGLSIETGEEVLETNEEDTDEDVGSTDNAFVVEDGVARFSSDILYDPTTGARNALDQVHAMLLKRFLFSIRSIRSMIYQFLLPLTFVVLLLVITNQLKKGSISDQVVPVHLWAKYRTNILFYGQVDSFPNVENIVRALKRKGPGTRCAQRNSVPKFPCESSYNKEPPPGSSSNEDCSSCTQYCTSSAARSLDHETLPTGDILFNITAKTNVTDWLIRVNSSRFISIGGYQFTSLDPESLTREIYDPLKTSNDTGASRLADIINDTLSKKRLILWTKPELQMAMLNGVNNILLRSLLNSSTAAIKVNLHKVRLNTNFKSISGTIITIISQILSGVFLMMAFSFASMPIVIFATYERSTDLKRLQRISGVNPALYWLTNFVYDFFMYLITFCIIILILGVAPGLYHRNVQSIVTIMLPYGVMITPFIYLITFLFATQDGVTTFFTILNFVSIYFGSTFAGFSIAFFMCEALEQSQDDCLFSWAPSVCDFLRILPPFYLSESMIIATFVEVYRKQPGPWDSSMFRDIYRVNMLGKYPITAIIVGIVTLLVVVILEYYNVNLDCGCNCRGGACCHRRVNEQHSGSYNIGSVDADVNNEENRVLRQPIGTDPLEVKQMRKVYPRSFAPAVSSVTFSVTREECFGLLGVNGAGKTTLFKMLTGFLTPTAGTALVEGTSIFSRKGRRSTQFSYCPQDNILIEHCTVLEHLIMFTRFRGVPSTVRSQLVRKIMQELDLIKYKHIRASQLSGGNQRKLQFALALFSYPPLIFLDEPTTGMDPGARRRCWRAINRAIARGTGVVLTSHTMEECEALCHRLVIMVCGQFFCIGSVQYLKNKFGDRYIFKLKLRSQGAGGMGTQATEALSLKGAIHQKMPCVTLVEDLPTLLHYNIPAVNVQLPELFRSLIQWQATFAIIDDFSVSQLTLEQVFINMAQKQEALQSGISSAGGTAYGSTASPTFPSQSDTTTSFPNEAYPAPEWCNWHPF